jgi:hypothetical protein
MAPRRGGSGHSSSSVGSGIQSCKDHDAFSTTPSIVIMAFVAFYFLVFLGLTWNVFRRKRDSPVGWVPLALSIVFMFMYGPFRFKHFACANFFLI